MRRLFFSVVLCYAMLLSNGQIISATKTNFAISTANILVDDKEDALLLHAANMLQSDIEKVIGKKISITHSLPETTTNLIIIGTVEQSRFIKELARSKKIKKDAMPKTWEGYSIQTLRNGQAEVLLIAGHDRRGAAYGVFELSRQMGVSPWYWWADVPVKHATEVYIQNSVSLQDAPKIKYRGIFINDEAPALSGWSKEKFGGFNHTFYTKVFELMLRLRANYLWPAMWGNAFYDDDSLNIRMAGEYGIVIGTSHHEPLMRAHDEWRRYGKGKWNYDSNKVQLTDFWTKGMLRASNEKIVSVGMRGDGDEPMSAQTATALLERIVQDQRKIIETTTGKPASQTPQLWALYKEVQDYYDKGMRVPDDVTVLLCDDNWGNLRKLPKLTDKPRKGGYGIYYHFDYVGGPRNYKWINTNPLPRIWEQMHLAYEHNVKDIWIVNVGDIKPMELPISFFLDYAWNPDAIGANDLTAYTQNWAAAQFGQAFSKEIAEILSKYAKYNGRKKPELLDEKTYHLFNYREADNVTFGYTQLLAKANQINAQLPKAYSDAFFQLVLHPVKASANLQQLYTAVAWNRSLAKNNLADANAYADSAKEYYLTDSLISLAYHQLNNGKWNHMMSQTHIGYTYWQQPRYNRMPDVQYVANTTSTAGSNLSPLSIMPPVTAKIPAGVKGNIFFEKDGYVSIEADHFTKVINNKKITWQVLPDHGKTGSAITPFPVTVAVQQPGGSSPHLQYEFYSYSKGAFELNSYFSPTLNFHGLPQGLQYAVSIDDEAPQIMSINSEDKNSISGIWNEWMINNIIIKKSTHKILAPGKHTLKYWMVHPGVVLQKLVLDFGGMKPSYLGPPETKKK